MTKLTLKLYRPLTESSDDENGKTEFHRQRSHLVHSLADALDLKVEDWGETDLPRAREVVEIIAVLGSAGVFTAMVTALKIWVERGRMLDVELVGPKGTIKIRSAASAADVSDIAKTLGLRLK